MSKVADMRALREANYIARHRGETRVRAPLSAITVPVPSGPCGLKNKAGRPCNRDADHGGNHRYEKAAKKPEPTDENEEI